MTEGRKIRRVAAQVLSIAGVLILGVDAYLSVPSGVAVLRDPLSHEAQDAGMTAIFLLVPVAIIGIGCLLLGFLLWRTRAGGVALATAFAVVAMVAGNLEGTPLLAPAIGVAIAGAASALWFVYRDWGSGSAG